MSINSELQRAYTKSGLRRIYEKNKSLIQNASLGLATGGLSVPFSILDDKKDKEKAKLQAFQREQQGKKDRANQGLDDLIGDIRGGDGLPTDTMSGGPFMPRYGTHLLQVPMVE